MTQWVKPLSVGQVYIQDPNSVITVPDDDLTPYSARTSAGTVMTTILHMFYMKFLRPSFTSNNLSWPNEVIQNGGK